MSDWYRQPAEEVLRRLEVDSASGLDGSEVERRRQEHGANELVEEAGRGIWRILLEQVRGALVILLVVAAGISAWLGEVADAVAILAIVLLNTVLGFIQDFRAEKAMAALRRMAVPKARVRRQGQVRSVPAEDLVPGDVLLLEAGDRVPADGRLVEAADLRVEEAALTGESEPVDKKVAPPEVSESEDGEVPLGDRRSAVFMGTHVVHGRATAVITETGMETELGRIAGLLHEVEREATPLQRRLSVLGRQLALVALGIVAVVFLLGWLRGTDLRLMFFTALSLAVAAVPEGLPAVATVALALGARRMLERRALIRRLPAVETLGSVTVICSDKTGTLTENRMTATAVETFDGALELPQETEDSEGAVTLLLVAACLCNDAEEAGGDGDGAADDQAGIGDPTELALVVAARRAGLPKERLERHLPRVAEIAFDSDRQRMTTLHRPDDTSDLPEVVRRLIKDTGAATLAFIKGAASSLLERADRVWEQGDFQDLTAERRERFEEMHDRLAGQGLRVLGVAFRPLEAETGGEDADLEGVEESLVLLGLIGLEDPLRPEAAEAVSRCRSAGIRALLITGDHALTARHVASSLGFDDEEAVTGRQLADLDEEQLQRTVRESSVYARVAPEHKLRIVEALEDQGELVAMTGDGVNDAPALRRADIGVAMGVVGTDVAKEAAEMVLLDDRFATIVSAVEEGRVIYDNIRKFLKYTLASNTGEIAVMLAAPLLGMPLPLVPLQILWINLVTDGLPGLALGVEPPERGLMNRPPHPPDESLFARGLGRDVLWIGLLMGAVSLGAGWLYWSEAIGRTADWRTVIFTVLTLSQMGNALALRSSRDSLWRRGFGTNRLLLAAVALTLVLQLVVIYLPSLQGIFRTQALPVVDLLICVGLSTLVFWGVEGVKAWRRWRRHS